MDLLAQSGSSLAVIPGIEVTTRQGHLLGLWVQQPIKMMRSVEWSIDAIKEQGGMVVVPHPLGKLVPSLSRKKIDELLETCSDQEVALHLNELGYTNWRGEPLTNKTVIASRNAYQLKSRYQRAARARHAGRQGTRCAT